MLPTGFGAAPGGGGGGNPGGIPPGRFGGTCRTGFVGGLPHGMGIGAAGPGPIDGPGRIACCRAQLESEPKPRWGSRVGGIPIAPRPLALPKFIPISSPVCVNVECDPAA